MGSVRVEGGTEGSRHGHGQATGEKAAAPRPRISASKGLKAFGRATGLLRLDTAPAQPLGSRRTCSSRTLSTDLLSCCLGREHAAPKTAGPFYLSHSLRTQPGCPHLQEAPLTREGRRRAPWAPHSHLCWSTLVHSITNALGLYSTPGTESAALTPARNWTDWAPDHRNTYRLAGRGPPDNQSPVFKLHCDRYRKGGV